MTLNWPLIENNITREDLDAVIDFLKTEPKLTQSDNVKAFEEEWSKWLGVKYSVMVNSGSSANLLTISALKEMNGTGEIIVSPLTWVSNIVSVIQCGFKPVFADINPRTLGMDDDQIFSKISDKTKGVLFTHILGLNGLTNRIINTLKEKNIPLIEDACESYGATLNGQNIGTFGLMSNFSFYYAHHMSTIEGGMISTNDEKLYQILRMYRSHGMVRESSSEKLRNSFEDKYPDLNPEFIFAYPGYNVRSTEINAVIGRYQLKRLDKNNEKRKKNFKLFLANLDSLIYRTNFDVNGSCNYAFILVLKKNDPELCKAVMTALRINNVEFRRGASGGGNQLRQPYLQEAKGKDDPMNYPEVEHIHFYGFYIGNYPDLEEKKILRLCEILNEVY